MRTYRYTKIIPMRPYVSGEDMTNITITRELIDELHMLQLPDNLVGGMIANNGLDYWYVSKEDFDDNYVDIDD